MKYKKMSERDVSLIHAGANGTCEICGTVSTLEAEDKVGRCRLEYNEPNDYLIWEILCPNCSNLMKCWKKR